MSTDKHALGKWKTRQLIGWKAIYTDGTVYRSDEYRWKDIPQRHFMGIKRYYKEDDKEPYGEMWTGQDIYILSDEYRDAIVLPNAIKIGEWMTDLEFHPLFDKMREEEEIIEGII